MLQPSSLPLPPQSKQIPTIKKTDAPIGDISNIITTLPKDQFEELKHEWRLTRTTLTLAEMRASVLGEERRMEERECLRMAREGVARKEMESEVQGTGRGKRGHG